MAKASVRWVVSVKWFLGEIYRNQLKFSRIIVDTNSLLPSLVLPLSEGTANIRKLRNNLSNVK